MLVLSLKENEEIIIGGIIRVSVVELRGNKVRIGVDAPSNISVHRAEIEAEIQQNGSRNGSLHAQPERDSPASDTAKVPTESVGIKKEHMPVPSPGLQRPAR